MSDTIKRIAFAGTPASPGPLRSRARSAPFLLLLALAACPTIAGTTACGDGSGSNDSTWEPPDPSDNDPCNGISWIGECRGSSIAYCVVGTGNAEPFSWEYPCGSGQTCSDSGFGPLCVSTGVCISGERECRDSALATCVEGVWQTTACDDGCIDSAIGSVCRPSIPTEFYENTLEYEYRAVNTSWTDWSAESFRAYGQGFLVVSFADGEILDATVTDGEGYFGLEVVDSAFRDGDDIVGIFTIRPNEARTNVAFAVMDPGLAASHYETSTWVQTPMPKPTSWFWSLDPDTLPSWSEIYLPLSVRSGAAYAFDYLRFVHDVAREFYGERDNTNLVMWFGEEVSWSCGACFYNYPTAGDLRVDSQIFMPATATDEAYWSGAVLAHELGHWLMATYGVSPGEGGHHILGIPTHPGIAWSEGFATWFSTLVRGQSTYYDKQNGLFFWIDLGARNYSSGTSWRRPDASEGLEQLIDENEVARMLIGLTNDSTAGPMMAALSSPRMTTPPYLRGYQRRAWEDLDDNGNPFPYETTDDSSPHLADFLDALVCSGAHAAGTVDNQTEPWVHYPYPSQSPACRSGELPIQVDWTEDGPQTLAEVRWYIPLERDLVLDFAPSLTGPTVIPAGTGPGQYVLAFAAVPNPLGATPRPTGLRVETSGEGWGLSGLSPYQPRPAATTPRDGLMVHLPRLGWAQGIAVAPRPSSLPPRRPIF